MSQHLVAICNTMSQHHAPNYSGLIIVKNRGKTFLTRWEIFSHRLTSFRSTPARPPVENDYQLICALHKNTNVNDNDSQLRGVPRPPTR